MAKVLMQNPTTFEQAEKLALDAEQICKLERADHIQLSYDVHQVVTKRPTNQTTVAAISTTQQSEIQELRQDVKELISCIRTMTTSQMTSHVNQQTSNQQRTTDGKPKCGACGGQHYTNSCKRQVSDNIFCTYCQKPRHTYENCRKRQRDQDQFTQFNQRGPQNSQGQQFASQSNGQYFAPQANQYNLGQQGSQGQHFNPQAGPFQRQGNC